MLTAQNFFSFRQNSLVRVVLSENPRAPGTNPSASSDKTPPREQFCRKLLEFSIQNCEVPARKHLFLPTKRHRANCFVGKSPSSRYKTARTRLANLCPIPTKHLRASCFVGKSPSSQRKTACFFRQNTLVPVVLSDTSRVLSPRQPACSDKTAPSRAVLSENPRAPCSQISCFTRDFHI